MFNIFQSTAPGKKPKRTVFDLSHEVKLSTDIGKLTPIFCEPTLPGDTWKMRNEIFLRFSPLLAPIFQRMSCFVHYFFIPNRLAWSKWSDFITGNEDTRTLAVYPRFVLTPQTYNGLSTSQKYYYFGNGSLIDYLGFPTLTTSDGKPLESIKNNVTFDAIPIISAYLIWYNFYRDENLDKLGIGEFGDTVGLPSNAEVLAQQVEDIVNGAVNGEMIMEAPSREGVLIWQILFGVKYRAWEKDYFTSALPWPQKGPDVLIPGTSGSSNPQDVTYEVTGEGKINSTGLIQLNDPRVTFEPGGNSSSDYIVLNGDAKNADYPIKGSEIFNGSLLNGGRSVSNIKANSSLEFDASKIAESLHVTASSLSSIENGEINDGTINNLRRALDLQRFLEAEGRGGTRYPEWLLQIFSVFPGDYKLQRPVYLGGQRSNVVISEVLQQSSTAETPDGETSALGDYAGRAVSAGSSKRITFKAEEYGYIIGFMSIRPRSGYMQGLPRKYQKVDRFDFGIPHFANLGEQEVKNSELFYDPNNSEQNDGTFGYQSRYSEYKFINNRTCGDMRGNLSFWHLTRKFSGLPGLNKEFIYIDPFKQTRIFAVDTQLITSDDEHFEDVALDHVYAQIYIDIKAKRPLPRYGIPR